MIDNDNVTGLLLLGAMAVAAVLTLGWEAGRGATEYATFKGLDDTDARCRTYRRWLWRSLLMFGGGSALMLAAAVSSVVPLRDAAQGFPRVAAYRQLLSIDDLATLGGAVVGATIGLGVLLGLRHVLKRHRPSIGPGRGAAPDFAALVPRNGREIRYGALTSVTAGVVEEVFFRLGLPAVLFAITGHAWLAFGLSILAFGLVHRYQGWTGVLVTGFFGWLMTVLYLGTGTIVVPIVLHALVDLRSLFFAPLIRAWRQRRRELQPAR